MSTMFARATGLASRTKAGGYGAVQRRRAGGIAQDTPRDTSVLKRAAKRDPELYVRG